MKTIYYSTIILLMSIYVVMLYQSGSLSFYVHPRYISFTYAMSLVALVFSMAGVIYWFEKGRDRSRLPYAEMLSSVLFLLVVGIGFLLPVKPLSSATAQQRIIDLNSLRYGEISTADRFLQNTLSYTLGDWVVGINNNPDPENYVGKEVDLSGFIFNANNTDSNFVLSRFVITCCAVDARPIGLEVSYNWREKFRENNWVRVQGSFAEVGGRLVIVPKQVDLIDTPRDPYIF